MRRMFVVALMSAGLLAATAAGSTAEAWSERGHGGYGGGYQHHDYGRTYYAPRYEYRPYYPPRHHHHHHYRPYGYGWR